jgi:hypothetical protein
MYTARLPTEAPPMRRLLLIPAAAVFAAAAILAQSEKPAAAEMTNAAKGFAAGLPAELKAKAQFDYDSPHRTEWFFTPVQENRQPKRKGVRFEELDAAQKKLALALLRSGLSVKGYEQATTIMSLEGILNDLEGPKGAMGRNPNWYFISLFGEPTLTGKWGWRFEGHHLSVNMTLDKGDVVAVSPVVFASNPAEVKNGARKGLRTLPEIEDTAKKLIASLNESQQQDAKQSKAHSEIAEKKTAAGVGEAKGVAYSALEAEPKKLLRQLVEAYANRLPADLAAAELKKADAAGFEGVKFAYWIDETKPGKPWTYRVQGPTFVVEFLNVQADGAKNPANHIHSGWRRLPIDFGL